MQRFVGRVHRRYIERAFCETMSTRPLILIVCTGNSCRSQMAEGVLRSALGSNWRVASAGSNPAGYVHPMAVQVMNEIGIDISKQRSKGFAAFRDEAIETVITVCGKADQACPVFPGQMNRHHWAFDDPILVAGSESERLDAFRQIRDEIRRLFEAYASGRLDEVRER